MSRGWPIFYCLQDSVVHRYLSRSCRTEHCVDRLPTDTGTTNTSSSNTHVAYDILVQDISFVVLAPRHGRNWYLHGFGPRYPRVLSDLDNDALVAPVTWESELSAKGNTKEVWIALLKGAHLSDIAFLRNIRNMVQAGVNDTIIVAELNKRMFNSVTPFRFIAAKRAVSASIDVSPQRRIVAALGAAMRRVGDHLPTLKGRTIVLVDVSGSMNVKLSDRSDLLRMDAAVALAAVAPCEDKVIVAFGSRTMTFEADDADPLTMAQNIIDKTGSLRGGTNLTEAINAVRTLPHDRLIVITDEESHSRAPPIATIANRSYMINVASNANTVAERQNGWHNMAGFSEHVFKWIDGIEKGEV